MYIRMYVCMYVCQVVASKAEGAKVKTALTGYTRVCIHVCMYAKW